MKKIISVSAFFMLAFFTWSCETKQAEATAVESNTVLAGQSGVKDDESAKDVVKVAVSSPDHTTLVAAVKQAQLVDALSNAGPFTVFAPLNSAFDKVPRETLDNLMKDENKEQLIDLLQYHVFVGGLSTELMQDGQNLNQVNGGNVTISKKDGKVMVNNANIIASIQASNGIVHVIDAVLLPPTK